MLTFTGVLGDDALIDGREGDVGLMLDDDDDDGGGGVEVILAEASVGAEAREKRAGEEGGRVV